MGIMIMTIYIHECCLWFEMASVDTNNIAIFINNIDKVSHQGYEIRFENCFNHEMSSALVTIINGRQ